MSQQQLLLYQVDAFVTDDPFSGNPAAVVPLPEWIPESLMQAIAAENNLSETAFFVPGGDGRFMLRWFTPTTEVDLCGHATLAAAFVVFEELEPALDVLRFVTSAAGVLSVRRQGDELVLDLPARPPRLAPSPEGLAQALGAEPQSLLAASSYLAVFDDARTVRGLRPDFAAIARLGLDGVIVTAPGDGVVKGRAEGGENGHGTEVDFVSRYFAPHAGIDEDPVTGAAHTTLVPYWAERLGRTTLDARQVSRRGGALRCELAGDRVLLAGRASLYLRGTIWAPADV